jgi:hypothetical protein
MAKAENKMRHFSDRKTIQCRCSSGEIADDTYIIIFLRQRRIKNAESQKSNEK